MFHYFKQFKVIDSAKAALKSINTSIVKFLIFILSNISEVIFVNNKLSVGKFYLYAELK